MHDKKLPGEKVDLKKTIFIEEKELLGEARVNTQVRLAERRPQQMKRVQPLSSMREVRRREAAVASDLKLGDESRARILGCPKSGVLSYSCGKGEGGGGGTRPERKSSCRSEKKKGLPGGLCAFVE